MTCTSVTEVGSTSLNSKSRQRRNGSFSVVWEGPGPPLRWTTAVTGSIPSYHHVTVIPGLGELGRQLSQAGHAVRPSPSTADKSSMLTSALSRCSRSHDESPSATELRTGAGGSVEGVAT